MTADLPTTLDHPQRLPKGRLWFGFAAGAAAWVVHGVAGFFVTWQACQDGDGSWGFLSELEVRWLLGLMMLAMLAVAAAAVAISYGNWRRLARHRRLTDDEATGREELMALGGVLIGSVFVFGILWSGLGPLLLDVCVTAK